MKGFDPTKKRRQRTNKHAQEIIRQLNIALNELFVINYINSHKKRRLINLNNL
jgi:hypothetical protein